MPAPSWERKDIDPPDQVTSEAVTGFLAGAFRFGSVSILAHMIMILPHPFRFSPPASPPTPSDPSQKAHARPRVSPFSKERLRSKLFYQPLEGFSEWLSPASRVYRGLTPQFKVFLQIAAMTLGGCVYAERRVDQYIKLVRKVKRAERREAEAAARFVE
ncbi:hypothetical protein BDW42DRAFT_192387 [Aspergillus taichungensis]|uniref:Uncharacterized protein n=1 Tax=Aspergillus taichungensis TaxID=482145 RepID=A0A2J5I0J4_9EURO|nr:hypothetical protein BDW42DRAFT_192387 [Aspergillus taichungensis]